MLIFNIRGFKSKKTVDIIYREEIKKNKNIIIGEGKISVSITKCEVLYYNSGCATYIHTERL